MTEEQITNRYVRGWYSLEQYRAALVEHYNRQDAKEKAERNADEPSPHGAYFAN